MKEDVSDFKREYLVVLPLFGTTLAISFDVGYFIWLDFDLFNVFSVSEHIAFAMQLVPFIVGASVVMITCSIAEANLKQGKKNNRAELYFLLGLVIIVFGAACYYSFVQTFFMAFGIVVGFVAILIVILIMTLPRDFFEHNILVISAATLLVIGSLVLGVDTARQQQNSKTYRYLIETNKTELFGRVLRSGERGLLILEESSQAIMLIPWKEIKTISDRNMSLRL